MEIEAYRKILIKYRTEAGLKVIPELLKRYAAGGAIVDIKDIFNPIKESFETKLGTSNKVLEISNERQLLELLQITNHHKLCRGCLTDHTKGLLKQTSVWGSENSISELREIKAKIKKSVSTIKKKIHITQHDGYTEWVDRKERSHTGVTCPHKYVYKTLQ